VTGPGSGSVELLSYRPLRSAYRMLGNVLVKHTVRMVPKRARFHHRCDLFCGRLPEKLAPIHPG
jgi:hypothetical protein